MRHLTKTLVFALTVSTALLPVTTWAAKKAEKNKQPVQHKKSSIDFIIMLNSTQATLKHLQAKNYRLTVPIQSIKSAVVFSTSPNKYAVSLLQGKKSKAGAALIKKYANPAKYLPGHNVALSINHGPIMPFVIKSFGRDGKSQQFELQAFSDYSIPTKTQLGFLSLTIDDLSTFCNQEYSGLAYIATAGLCSDTSSTKFDTTILTTIGGLFATNL